LVDQTKRIPPKDSGGLDVRQQSRLVSIDAPQRGDYYRVELKQLSISDVILGDYLKLGWIAAITNPIYTE
jgi:hypothetical protein